MICEVNVTIRFYFSFSKMKSINSVNLLMHIETVHLITKDCYLQQRVTK